KARRSMEALNRQRAETASAAIDAFRAATGMEADVVDDVIIDLLAATMHLINRFGVPDPNASFESLADRAKRTYTEQLREKPDICAVELDGHTCVRFAGHGEYYACPDTCKEEGHLRVGEFSNYDAVLEYQKKHYAPVYFRFP